MQLKEDLTNDREKRYTSKHQPNDLTNVLHRSVETATQSRQLERINTLTQVHRNSSVDARKMRVTLTVIFFFGLLDSCTIPADVKLFNNSATRILVTSGEYSVSVEPRETRKITTVLRHSFNIEIGEDSYNYELKNWPGGYEFTTGWGPFTKRVLILQVNSDGRVWIVAKGQELPIPESTPQPDGYPLDANDAAESIAYL